MVFVVAAVNADPGYYISPIGNGRCEQLVVSRLVAGPPPGVAVAPNGDIYFIELKIQPNCNEPRLIVVRKNGSRARFALPPEASLKEQGQLGGIAALRVGSDGIPFITVAVRFSGAYSGVREAVYSLRRATWIREAFDSLPTEYRPTSNAGVGAVLTSVAYCVNWNYLKNTAVDLRALLANPDLYRPVVSFVRRGLPDEVSSGTVTAMAGRFAAGFASRYRDEGIPQALRWEKVQREVLGRGVAFAVDRTGDTVGDNRSAITERGQPMLWRHHYARVLSSGFGTALAVRNETIVGTVDGRAFIADGKAVLPKARLLGPILGRSWSFSTAFAVAEHGDIVAIGTHSGESAPTLVRLIPVPKTARHRT